jgi:hypothetical protein
LGELAVNQPYLALRVGGVILVGDGPLIAMHDEPVLSTTIGEDGELSLALRLYDESGRLVAEIEGNEWITGDPLPWDMESDHQLLVIRSALYKVNLAMNAKREPISIRGKLWHAGRKVELLPSGVAINNRRTGIAALSDGSQPDAWVR